MHLEPLDARRLAAHTTAAGLDPHFGEDGQVTFTDATPGTNIRDLYDGADRVLVAGGGAVFVAGTSKITNGPCVIKLNDRGRIDTSFGTNGYAAIPYEAVELDYDPAGGGVYVGTNSVNGDNRGEAATVTRLKANGQPDAAFGTAGTFSYTPGDSAAATGAATVERINPLADGSSVVAIDRQDAGGQSLVLFKLRPNGTRDPAYGKRGVVQLLTGTFGAYTGSVPYGGTYDLVNGVHRGFFADVQTDRHGTTHVLIRYEQGVAVQSSETAYLINQEANYGRYDIKSRVVNADGIEDTAAAHSWELLDSGADKNFTYAVQYVGQDRNGVHAVVAVRGRKHNSSSLLFTMTPGRRATSQTLAPEGLDPTFSFTRSANGTYVAYDSRHAVRLRSNFAPDPTFADHGLATVQDYFLDAAYADDSGRFLALDGYNVLDRFE